MWRGGRGNDSSTVAVANHTQARPSLKWLGAVDHLRDDVLSPERAALFVISPQKVDEVGPCEVTADHAAEGCTQLEDLRPLLAGAEDDLIRTATDGLTVVVDDKRFRVSERDRGGPPGSEDDAHHAALASDGATVCAGRWTSAGHFAGSGQ